MRTNYRGNRKQADIDRNRALYLKARYDASDNSSPFLTLEEGARYCRFDNCDNPTIAFRKWLDRQAVPIVRRGRVLLVERRVLDSILRRIV